MVLPRRHDVMATLNILASHHSAAHPAKAPNSGSSRFVMMPVPCRLAIALTVVAFASNSAAQESCKASIDTAAVSEVRDGRTLLLADGRELRLAAIEVTEASRAVLQSLAARQTLRLEKLGPGQDRYGRLVAFAYTGDMQTSLQQTMIEQGHAQVSARIGDKHCADLLLARERAARAARRGIWADPNFAPLPSHDVTRITAVRGLPWWKARSCRCGRAAPQYMLISGGDGRGTLRSPFSSVTGGTSQPPASIPKSLKVAGCGCGVGSSSAAAR